MFKSESVPLKAIWNQAASVTCTYTILGDLSCCIQSLIGVLCAKTGHGKMVANESVFVFNITTFMIIYIVFLFLEDI